MTYQHHRFHNHDRCHCNPIIVPLFSPVSQVGKDIYQHQHHCPLHHYHHYQNHRNQITLLSSSTGCKKHLSLNVIVFNIHAHRSRWLLPGGVSFGKGLWGKRGLIWGISSWGGFIWVRFFICILEHTCSHKRVLIREIRLYSSNKIHNYILEILCTTFVKWVLRCCYKKMEKKTDSVNYFMMICSAAGSRNHPEEFLFQHGQDRSLIRWPKGS